MKVFWVNGPLDGCAAELSVPPALWVGPDLSDPQHKVVVYLLQSSGKYLYDQEATDIANRRCTDR